MAEINSYVYIRNHEREIIRNAKAKGIEIIYSATNRFIIIEGVTYNGWSKENVEKL